MIGRNRNGGRLVYKPMGTLSATSYTYDGTAKKPTVTVKDGTTTIQTSEYTLTCVNNVKVGTGTVKVADKSGGNYTLTATSKTFTIKK